MQKLFQVYTYHTTSCKHTLSKVHIFRSILATLGYTFSQFHVFFLFFFSKNGAQLDSNLHSQCFSFKKKHRLFVRAVTSKGTLFKWYRKLGFCYKWCNRCKYISDLILICASSLQLYFKQDFDTGLSYEICKILQPVNSIKSKIPAQMIVNFEKFFILQLYLKQDSSTGVFP